MRAGIVDARLGARVRDRAEPHRVAATDLEQAGCSADDIAAWLSPERVRRPDDAVAPETVDIVEINVEGAWPGARRDGEALAALGRRSVLPEGGPDTMAIHAAASLRAWSGSRGHAVRVPDRVPRPDGGGDLPGFLHAHPHPRRAIDHRANLCERRDQARIRARAGQDLKRGATRAWRGSRVGRGVRMRSDAAGWDE